MWKHYFFVIYLEEFVVGFSAVVLLLCCVTGGLTYLTLILRFIQPTPTSYRLISIKLTPTFRIQLRYLGDGIKTRKSWDLVSRFTDLLLKLHDLFHSLLVDILHQS